MAIGEEALVCHDSSMKESFVAGAPSRLATMLLLSPLIARSCDGHGTTDGDVNCNSAYCRGPSLEGPVPWWFPGCYP